MNKDTSADRLDQVIRESKLVIAAFWHHLPEDYQAQIVAIYTAAVLLRIANKGMENRA